MTEGHGHDHGGAARAAVSASGEEGRLMRRATYAAVGLAFSLVLAKAVAWLATGSVAMLSTMVDSLLDCLASVFTLIAVRQSLQPADSRHRFGHGKAEPLGALAQAAFVTGSALFLIFEGARRLIDPVPVQQGTLGIAVMVGSLLGTGALVLFQRHVARRTGSLAVEADSLHYAGDVLSNLVVIAALLLSTELGWIRADAALGLTVAAYLLYGAFGIARRALGHLMDQEFADADRTRILDIARANPHVTDVHDLRTRSSGREKFIQLHLELPRELTLWKAHAIADQVERDIQRAFPDADVIIHQDPTGLSERHPDLHYTDDSEEARKAGLP